MCSCVCITSEVSIGNSDKNEIKMHLNDHQYG